MTALRYPSDFATTGPASDYIKIQFIRRDYTASTVQYNHEGFPDIFLNMPQKITENLSQNFANSQLGELGILDAFGNRSNMQGGPFQNAIKRVVENFALNNSVKMANRLGASQLTENGILSGVSGIVFNPNLEVLYEGPDFRRFNFQFALFTKSKKDAAQIKSIVDTFRLASLPNLSGADVSNTNLKGAFATIAGLQVAQAAGTGIQGALDTFIKGNKGAKNLGLGFVKGALNNGLSAAGTLAAAGGTGGAFFSGGNRFIKQPPFVLLEYMRGTTRHPFIPSLLPAAINQINFDYTPTGNYTQLSNFGDANEATTIGVVITLQLTEVTNLFGDQLTKTNQDGNPYQPKKPTIKAKS